MTERGKIINKSPLKTDKKARKFSIGLSRKDLCIPYGIFLCLFVVLPLLVIVYYAFTDSTGNVTAENFIDFFTDTTKISTLIISILVSLVVTIICLLLAYPVAYILSRMKGQVAFILLLLFIMPMWINFVLRSMEMK